MCLTRDTLCLDFIILLFCVLFKTMGAKSQSLKQKTIKKGKKITRLAETTCCLKIEH